MIVYTFLYMTERYNLGENRTKKNNLFSILKKMSKRYFEVGTQVIVFRDFLLVKVYGLAWRTVYNYFQWEFGDIWESRGGPVHAAFSWIIINFFFFSIFFGFFSVFSEKREKTGPRREEPGHSGGPVHAALVQMTSAWQGGEGDWTNADIW